MGSDRDGRGVPVYDLRVTLADFVSPRERPTPELDDAQREIFTTIGERCAPDEETDERKPSFRQPRPVDKWVVWAVSPEALADLDEVGKLIIARGIITLEQLREYGLLDRIPIGADMIGYRPSPFGWEILRRFKEASDERTARQS